MTNSVDEFLEKVTTGIKEGIRAKSKYFQEEKCFINIFVNQAEMLIRKVDSLAVCELISLIRESIEATGYYSVELHSGDSATIPEATGASGNMMRNGMPEGFFMVSDCIRDIRISLHLQYPTI